MSRWANPKRRRRKMRELDIAQEVTLKLTGEDGFKIGDRVELKSNWRATGTLLGRTKIMGSQTRWLVRWFDGSTSEVLEDGIDHESPF